jgi:hypothetical protein
MNWRLVLQLSMFGLAMGFGTVFLIPSTIEPVFWLVIFVVSAYVIARRVPERRFAHGVMLGIFNSIWITTAHVALFDQYLAHHPEEAQMMQSMSVSMPVSPRLFMLMMGPMVGVFSGAVIGVLALIAGKLLPNRAKPRN